MAVCTCLGACDGTITFLLLLATGRAAPTCLGPDIPLLAARFFEHPHAMGHPLKGFLFSSSFLAVLAFFGRARHSSCSCNRNLSFELGQDWQACCSQAFDLHQDFPLTYSIYTGANMFTEEHVKNLKEQAEVLLAEKFSKGLDRECELLASQLLKVDPLNCKVVQLLGLVKHKQHLYQEAMGFFDRALEIEPGNYENHNNKALCLSGLGKYEEAIGSLLKARELRPDLDFIHANLALQYRSAGMIEDAISSFRKALSIKETCETWGMLGGCYGELRDLDASKSCFDKSLELNPDFAASHVDMASIHQFRGEWHKSWDHYERRFELYEQSKFWNQVYDPAKRLQKGAKVNGMRILVHPEQGTGDVIHFFRYIPELRRKGAHVILHCWESLKPLMEHDVDEVYTREPATMKKFSDPNGNDVPNHDGVCSIVSLPYVLEAIQIPEAPYLQTKESFDTSEYNDCKLKIGIVWAGNPQHPNDKFRSCKLSEFKMIHDIGGVRLFNLQKDMRPRMYRFSSMPIDLTEGAQGMKIVDCSEFQSDYGKTAALIDAMDLVITVDTSVLHLAGAMGKKTFALLSRNCDWRWKMDGSTTDWYGSVRLFRQKRLDVWSDVFEEVRAEVEGML